MRSTPTFLAAAAVAAAGFLHAGQAVAQQPPAHMHIAHVADGFRDTPEGRGLLTTAVEEARVVAQHAGLMAGSPGNLNGMKNHAGHVIHAIDPTAVTSGPGLGYGLKRAAEGAVSHIELAAAAQGASPAVGTHATHIATSTRNTLQRAEEILALAGQIQAAETAEAAAALAQQLKTLADQLLPGVDANGDGRIGWQEGEGGLDVVVQHVGLLKTAEGLPG